MHTCATHISISNPNHWLVVKVYVVIFTIGFVPEPSLDNFSKAAQKHDSTPGDTEKVA